MGSIIVPEHKLRDIVSKMPQVDYGGTNGLRTIQFGWGDKKQLNKYLALKKDDSYPLIWLLNPRPKTCKANQSLVERDCNLVIATLESRKDMNSMERFDASFDIILNPITDLIFQGIGSATTTRFLNDDEQVVNDFPDYSDDANSNSSGVIALWDAIRIDCKIEFNNSCLKNIKWITQ